MDDIEVGFIGLGLIGGSLAKAIRKTYPSCTIIAYDCDKEALDTAISDGTITRRAEKIDGDFSNCNIIFLCAPVAFNLRNLELVKKCLSPDCIITDVGSVKTAIHETVIELGLESQFIGGHPMAGSEKTGFLNATAHMLENAYYILTPSKCISNQQIQFYETLIQSLGALPMILDYKEHDYITAAISHLPHIIASGLVNLVAHKDSREAHMKTLAAGGFKDITRIASSSPRLWQQICQLNKENLKQILKDYIALLESMKHAIDKENETEIYRYFDSAKEYRNSFSDFSSGPLKKEFEIYCDIVNEPGIVAKIVSILANQNISIKSIDTIHNREFEEAVLSIGFYSQDDYENAIFLLKSYDYTVYKR